MAPVAGLLAGLLLSTYYWTLHPLILLGLRRTNSTNNDTKTSSNISNIGDDPLPAYIIIPTFGSRYVLVEKVRFLNELFSSDKLFRNLIKKVIIVYSKPDKSILRDITEESAKHRDRYVIIIENKRSGKMSAILSALRLIDKNEEKDYVAIIVDDDLFFSTDEVFRVINLLSTNEKLGAISVAPLYQDGINLFYKVKRFIHKLEGEVCSPGAIYGDFLAIKRSALELDKLETNTLAEDYQLCLHLSSKGYDVLLLEGKVREGYPHALFGTISRTTRTVLGTFLEYKRHFRKLLNRMKCFYIYTSYTFSLLTIPIASLIALILLAQILYKTSTNPIYLVIGTSLLIAPFLVPNRRKIISMIKFILGINIGIVISYYNIIKAIFSKKIRLESIWKETKTYNQGPKAKESLAVVKA